MKKKKKELKIPKATLILAVLVGMLLLANFLSYTGMTVASKNEKWACSQYVCDKVTTAQDWVNKNCYMPQDGSDQAVCRVIVENQEQIVPLSTIKTESLNRCVEARCVQEARVRTVDYKVGLQLVQ